MDDGGAPLQVDPTTVAIVRNYYFQAWQDEARSAARAPVIVTRLTSMHTAGKVAHVQVPAAGTCTYVYTQLQLPLQTQLLPAHLPKETSAECRSMAVYLRRPTGRLGAHLLGGRGVHAVRHLVPKRPAAAARLIGPASSVV